MPDFRVRTTGFQEIKAKFLVPDPLNYRGATSEAQTVGLDSALSEIGFAGALLVRPHPEKRNRWFVVDGHERLSRFAPDDLVPCLVLDLDEQEAKKLLATYDPIGYLKTIDEGAFARLRSEIGEFDFEPLDDAIELGLERIGIDLEGVGSETESETDDSTLSEGGSGSTAKHTCPKCGHTWTEDETD